MHLKRKRGGSEGSNVDRDVLPVDESITYDLSNEEMMQPLQHSSFSPSPAGHPRAEEAPPSSWPSTQMQPLNSRIQGHHPMLASCLDDYPATTELVFPIGAIEPQMSHINEELPPILDRRGRCVGFETLNYGANFSRLNPPSASVDGLMLDAYPLGEWSDPNMSTGGLGFCSPQRIRNPSSSGRYLESNNQGKGASGRKGGDVVQINTQLDRQVNSDKELEEWCNMFIDMEAFTAAAPETFDTAAPATTAPRSSSSGNTETPVVLNWAPQISSSHAQMNDPSSEVNYEAGEVRADQRRHHHFTSY